MLLKGLQFENKVCRRHLEITVCYFNAASSGHGAWTPFSKEMLNNTARLYSFTVITANTVKKKMGESFATDLMTSLLKFPPF